MHARAQAASTRSADALYEVRIHSGVGQALGRLSEEERSGLLAAFETLRDEPRPTHAVWAGAGQYLLPLGVHQVRYLVDEAARTLLVVELGRRPQR